ncbi:MAG: MFS transporter [Oscillochloridaceae bacterium]|nr:MFS transporter [Chloroflexaceae bacterium]MDW8389773.1 MFS transporter [Oscillochloridaceae bacterium]
MAGYLRVLRANRNYRRLWYGQVVSQIGDWLDSVALFTLTLNLTGSGQAVGLLFLAEFLPGAAVGPFAGVIVDRLPRKLVLIASDLGRAVTVMLLLLVSGPEDLWLLYLAVVAKVSLTAFFEPARSAILPGICSREELAAANAISGATWSAMLALGAALGGVVAGTLGVRAAFLLDAVSFLLSAVLIATVRVPRTRAPDPFDGTRPIAPRPPTGARGALSEFREGLRYVLTRPEIGWLTFSKAIWSLGGGVLLLLTLYGREIAPLGRDGAVSIGLLYAARGVGTGIGPFLALRLGGSGQRFLRRSVATAFFISAAGYLSLGFVTTLPLAALCVLFAHIGGSIQWVFSTTLLQSQVPDRLLGRVFATEYAALTFTTALSAYLTGVARDAGATPAALAMALGGIFAASGVVMLAALWPEPMLAEMGDRRS